MEAFTYDDLCVESRSGGLFVKSEKPRSLTVYDMHGHRVVHINVCGEELVKLPKGIYIVDGKKMLVD